MKAATCAVLALGALSGANGAIVASSSPLKDTYPATFPYENELHTQVKELPNFADYKNLDPASSPDVGGYAAAALAYCNPFAWEPHGLYTGGGSHCGHSFQHFFYNWFTVLYDDLVPINCTQAKVNIAGPFNGNFAGGEQVCDPASCCSDYYGHVLMTEEYKSQQDKWDTRYTKYGCSWYTHDVYCFILMFNFVWCSEYFDWPTLFNDSKQSRSLVVPCINAFDYFLSQCSSFKALGAKPLVIALQIEPDAYTDTLTPAEANTALSLFYANDHVCVPLGDLEPSLKAAPAPADDKADDSKDSSKDSKDSSSGSSSSSSSDDKDSAASLRIVTAVVSFIAARFF